MKENDFPGTLIVVEGPDGSGTTTQAEKLADELEGVYTAEPTGGLVGEKVEEMISTGGYSPEAISLAFASDRMLHLEEEVIELLKEGEVVIMDRYYHSSLVYQPALGADYGWVQDLNKDAVKPDITFVLDVSSREALKRIEDRENDIAESAVEEGRDQASLSQFDSGQNIFENLSFQEEVITRYRRLPERLDEEIILIDSSRHIEKVFQEVKDKAFARLDLD
ncbi:MAG: dTMP kinase [Candidatus Nanohalobium sp.]